MQIKLHYGLQSELSFQVAEESLLHVHGQDAPQNLTLAQLPQAVFDALEHPIEFPPLRECLLDSDHLVIPIAPGIPHAETILRSVLEYVFGTSPEHQPLHVTILRTRSDEAAGIPSFDAILPHETPFSEDALRKKITIRTHHPDKKEEMALLGVDETNETLVIHREMFDAEFVLPIGFFLPKGTPGHFGIHTAVYPTFSDAQTHERFQNFGPQMHATQHELMHQLEHEISEATRQLGVLCMLQIVPGIPTLGTSNVVRVMAGDFRELESSGYSLYCELWTLLSERRLDVVLATMNGPEAASWNQAILALEHASRLVRPETGIIVLASDLAAAAPEDLPRFLQIYHQVQTPETAEKFIRRENLPDQPLALKLLQILTHYRVFFLSSMNGELLEELNVMPLEGAGELERLIANSGSLTILPDAQRIIN